MICCWTSQRFAAGLGLSALRPCGRVGWPPFPLHVLSSVVLSPVFLLLSAVQFWSAFMSRANDLHSLSAAFSQCAHVAACTDTVFIGFQGVFASPGLLTTSSGVPSQPRCSRPLLKPRAPVLARQLRCRNLRLWTSSLVRCKRTLWPVAGGVQQHSLHGVRQVYLQAQPAPGLGGRALCKLPPRAQVQRDLTFSLRRAPCPLPCHTGLTRVFFRVNAPTRQQGPGWRSLAHLRQPAWVSQCRQFRRKAGRPSRHHGWQRSCNARHCHRDAENSASLVACRSSRWWWSSG